MKLTAISQDTGRGVRIGLSGNDKSQSTFWPSNDADLPPAVVTARKRLMAGTALFTGSAEQKSGIFLAEQVGTALRSDVAILRSDYQNYVSIVGSATVDQRRVCTQLMSVPPATATTAPIRARAVSLYDACQNDAARVEFAMQRASFLQLQGLAEVDAWSGLDEPVRKAIEDRFTILSYIQKYGVESKFPMPAGPDFPIPSGVDKDAVQAEGKRMVGAMRRVESALEGCSLLARDVIVMVAFALETSVNEAFALLTANG
ncbi:hypothetical protein [Bradyrhizobium japonicum]|uniref:hypothetical protein n=1 Tax=Bradyrhizobium japonicum TaxID=375 RepID=UPI000577241B|nr:hypothetical protein [Bradyrhizobium japonicum]